MQEFLACEMSDPKMRIILINHYSGSPDHGMEYRPYYFAREWSRSGHDVTLVAASFSHLRAKQPNFEVDLSSEVVDGIKYVWIKTPDYADNGLARVINMLTFAWRIYNKTREILDGCPADVVVASSPHPFIILGARRMALLSGAKLLFEVRDLWPLTLIELGNISRFHPFILLMQWFENYAYRVADKVISLLPLAKSYMMAHGMPDNHFSYIPNGANIEEWQTPSDGLPQMHVETIEKLRSQGDFIVGYAGHHGIANALKYLIEGAVHLSTHPISIVLVGKGPEKETLIKLAVHLNLKNVVFLPEVPKSAIPSLLEMMDVLYIGWNRDPLYRFGVSPNKLIDYMMAAKPVVHSIESGNDIVAESGCGVSTRPEDPLAIADAIIEVFEMDGAQRALLGQKGRTFVLDNFDYRVLATQFLAGVASLKAV